MTQTHFDDAQRPLGPAGRYQGPSHGLTEMVSAWMKKFEAALLRWANRRAIYKLSAMDDRLLKDIGLTRADVTWALSLPGDVDPSEELSDLIRRRRDARDWARRHPTQ